jgi:hypothetical protein
MIHIAAAVVVPAVLLAQCMQHARRGRGPSQAMSMSSGSPAGPRAAVCQVVRLPLRRRHENAALRW